MLDPIFKSLFLMIFFIGHDQGAIVEQYDTTLSLYPMFMKFYNGFAY
jgi:hypothetical protein